MYGFGNKLYGFVSNGVNLLKEALQWLSTIESPSTVLDKTTNELNATLKGSPMITLNGGDQYGETGLTCSNNTKIRILLKYNNMDFGRIGCSSGKSASAPTFQFINSSASGFRAQFGSQDTGIMPSISDLNWHWHELSQDGYYVEDADGANRTLIYSFTTETFETSATFWIGAEHIASGKVTAPKYCSVAAFKLYENGILQQKTPIVESSGLTSYDVSGNGNDITWEVGSGSEAVIWSGTQDGYHYLAKYGFYVATQFTAPYIPALPDGSGYAANGELVSNPGGYLFNGGPQYLEQLSTSATTLGHSGAWFDTDEVTLLQVYYADAIAWANYTDNTLFNFKTLSNGTCVCDKAIVFAEDKTYTLAEYNKLQSIMPNTCGADALEPVTDNGEIVTSDGEVVWN